MYTFPAVAFPEPYRLDPLTERFVGEYLACTCNVHRAAKKCGISLKQAEELLQDREVRLEIRDRREELREKLNLTQEFVLTRLAAIADTSITDIGYWRTDNREMVEADGDITRQAGFILHNSDELLSDHAYAIAEIGNTKDGIKIKMMDRRAALMDIAKIMGHVTDKLEVTSKNDVDLAKLSDDDLREYRRVLEKMTVDKAQQDA